VEICARVYRPRRPRETALFQLLESLYDTVKGVWEERFETRYGFWRGRWDDVVARYLDCGDWSSGFARVRCGTCAEEFLVAFSCKERGLCPSCGAKRGAELAAFVAEEVIEEVGHAQWVFTVPKMLRFFFFRRRELLGDLSRLAYETVRELMAAAAGENSFYPGMVTMLQTFGERVNPHPHVHALVSRGGWTGSGEWIPVPYVDPQVAERLFRHKVLRLLRRKELLSQERLELLLSWRYSGFSVHNEVRLAAGDTQALEALVRYMMRPAVSLSRLVLQPDRREVLYFPRPMGPGRCAAGPERVDALEFVARVLAQIPEPRRHLVRYYGRYSNVARGRRRKAAEAAGSAAAQPEPTPCEVSSLRRRWAELIRRVYEIDPLVCPKCGSEMRVIGFVTEPRVIRRILDHLENKTQAKRGPPGSRPAPALAPA
jgi:hypothetical protein